MYPTSPNEILVETKTCRHCQSPFPITDKDIEFYEKVSPVFGGKKYLIPSPTLCPDCRQQRRLSFRNERKLYKRKCDLTGKDIISIYAPCEMKGSLEVLLGCGPDKPYKVYEQSEWWSDKWDPMEYGRDFDFSRGFFEQYGELMRDVPRPSLLTAGNESSDFTNYSSYLKDCYFMFDSPSCENCYYGNNVGDSRYCVDTNVISNCENIYECVDCVNSYNLFFSQNCSQCKDSYFLKNCTNCSYCIGCCNLQNKEYCIENQFVGKEKFVEELLKIKQKFQFYNQMYLKKNGLFPKKSTFLVQTENVFGDTMIGSKNCYSCFDGIHFENCKYCSSSGALKDCYDCRSIGGPASRSYEVDAAMECENVMFATGSWGSYIWYSDLCTGNNLFGCIGIHNNQQYCILNKQYTREEYEALVPKIIEHMMKAGEWGEFFPSSLSPFGYNETVAQEYYPMDRRGVIIPPTPLSKGGSEERTEGFIHGSIFNWSDYEAPFPKVEKIIPASKLPDDITKIPDDILNWAIMPDDDVGNDRVVPFRIIKQELEFYRKHNLPIPRRHPDQRHLDRMKLRNPRKLFERKCDKCGVAMMTTYSNERKEIVYCEGCYNKEIL